MKNKKNTSREKRVLIASLLVAAVMIGGSTFAWFTSKDEVTNRLSASADYGVSITEDFTPPSDWIPGQNVKKEVAAVNTGSVDAFVRMWLTGEMKLVGSGDGVAPVSIGTLSEVTEAPYTELKLTQKDSSNYYRILTDADRVSLQTGELAYAAGAYTCIMNQLDDDAAAYGTGSTSTDTTTGATIFTGNAYTNGGGATIFVDSDSFTPSEPGLYIFRRNYDLDSTAGNVDPETAQFSGYYYDGTHYFALKTANDSTVENGVEDAGKNVYISELAGKTGRAFTDAIGDVLVYTAKDNSISNDDLVWTYTEPDSAADSPFGTTDPYFVVTQDGGSDTFKINVKLANIGTAIDQWAPKSADGKITTFYYTDDVEAGETTNILVETVQLDKDVTQNDFLAFDFDLNVNLESIQVTKDDDGKETADSVATWGATDDDNTVGASGSATAGADLGVISWS